MNTLLSLCVSDEIDLVIHDQNSEAYCLDESERQPYLEKLISHLHEYSNSLNLELPLPSFNATLIDSNPLLRDKLYSVRVALRHLADKEIDHKGVNTFLSNFCDAYTIQTLSSANSDLKEHLKGLTAVAIKVKNEGVENLSPLVLSRLKVLNHMELTEAQRIDAAKWLIFRKGKAPNFANQVVVATIKSNGNLFTKYEINPEKLERFALEAIPKNLQNLGFRLCQSPGIQRS